MLQERAAVQQERAALQQERVPIMASIPNAATLPKMDSVATVTGATRTDPGSVRLTFRVTS